MTLREFSEKADELLGALFSVFLIVLLTGLFVIMLALVISAVMRVMGGAG